MDSTILGAEGCAAAEFFQHVVHAGECKLGVFGLLTLAMNVQLLGEVADARALLSGGVRERVGFKAASLVVPRTIFKSTAGCQRPNDMDSGRQNTEV